MTELEKGSATELSCGGAFCVIKRVGQSQHSEAKKKEQIGGVMITAIMTGSAE